MPRIVCQTCGREVYTSAPLEQLFADERRCPRCGAPLQNDRRATDRRRSTRRVNPTDDPGPPSGAEQRTAERRAGGRRRADKGPGRRDSGWQE